MKFFIATILLLTTSVSHAQAQVEIRRDRFTQEIKIGTEVKADVSRLKLDGQPAISLLGVYKAERLQELSLFITSLSSRWRYLDCNHTNWLIDGRPLTVSGPIRAGNVYKSGNVSEDLVFRPTLAQLHQFAGAKRVEYRVCNDEYVASAQEMRNFRDMVRLLQIHDPGRSSYPSTVSIPQAVETEPPSPAVTDREAQAREPAARRYQRNATSP